MEEVSGGLQSNQGINVDVTRETFDLIPSPSDVHTRTGTALQLSLNWVYIKTLFAI